MPVPCCAHIYTTPMRCCFTTSPPRQQQCTAAMLAAASTAQPAPPCGCLIFRYHGSSCITRLPPCALLLHDANGARRSAPACSAYWVSYDALAPSWHNLTAAAVSGGAAAFPPITCSRPAAAGRCIGRVSGRHCCHRPFRVDADATCRFRNAQWHQFHSQCHHQTLPLQPQTWHKQHTGHLLAGYGCLLALAGAQQAVPSASQLAQSFKPHGYNGDS